jgi:serine protease inhibitor
VKIVNRAYSSSQTCTLRQEFLRSAEDSLHADALSVDFSNPNTESAINQWVEEVTQNKIKNLIAPGSLSFTI